MDNLYFRIKAIHPSIKDGEFAIQDNGDGPFICEWKSGLPQPAEAQLLTADWRSAVPDPADFERVPKNIKAVLLCVAQVGGLSNAAIKTMFKNKMDALP